MCSNVISCRRGRSKTIRLNLHCLASVRNWNRRLFIWSVSVMTWVMPKGKGELVKTVINLPAIYNCSACIQIPISLFGGLLSVRSGQKSQAVPVMPSWILEWNFGNRLPEIFFSGRLSSSYIPFACIQNDLPNIFFFLGMLWIPL